MPRRAGAPSRRPIAPASSGSSTHTDVTPAPSRSTSRPDLAHFSLQRIRSAWMHQVCQLVILLCGSADGIGRQQHEAQQKPCSAGDRGERRGPNGEPACGAAVPSRRPPGRTRGGRSQAGSRATEATCPVIAGERSRPARGLKRRCSSALAATGPGEAGGLSPRARRDAWRRVSPLPRPPRSRRQARHRAGDQQPMAPRPRPSRRRSSAIDRGDVPPSSGVTPLGHLSRHVTPGRPAVVADVGGRTEPTAPWRRRRTGEKQEIAAAVSPIGRKRRLLR